MSDERPTNERLFPSSSRVQSRNARAKTAETVAACVFGRQGPEVRILSPRPLLFSREVLSRSEPFAPSAIG
jgi:hypothetical protein